MARVPSVASLALSAANSCEAADRRGALRSCFQAQLVERVLASDTRDWTAMLTAAQGATPGDVLEALLAVGVPIPEFDGVETVSPEVPEGHLIHFEWFFDAPTAELVAELLIEAGGPAVLLGAPTVARALAGFGHRALLYDNSPTTSIRLDGVSSSVVNRDIAAGARPQDVGAAAAIFFDAPWHLGDMIAWLTTASHLARPSGLIAFALFEELTKPSAVYERAKILEMAASLGDVHLSPRALVYDTPPFEAAALHAVGAPAPRRWRRADLAVVTVRSPLLAATALPVPEQWDTWAIGPQVVKLRRTTRPGRGISQVQGVRGWTLPSVSRSHPARDRVDVWSSRNRVATVGQQDRERVSAWLTALSAGRQPRDRCDDGTLEQLSALLSDD